MRGRVNAEAVGARLVDAAALAASAPRAVRAGRPRPRARGRAALDDALVEEREERVVLAGTANLARFGTDFPLTIGPVLEALEEHVVLLKLLGTARRDRDAVAVRIGHENPSTGSRRPRWSRPGTARAPSWWPASACSVRPGWTTRRRWPRCGPWRATSPGFSAAVTAASAPPAALPTPTQ